MMRRMGRGGPRPNSGGYRPGSGKKRLSDDDVKRTRLAFGVHPQRYQAFKEVCAADHRTVTEALDEYVEMALRNGTTCNCAGHRAGTARSDYSPRRIKKNLRINAQRYQAFKEVLAADKRTITEALDEYVVTALQSGTTRFSS
jgi:hypothetical protein